MIYYLMRGGENVKSMWELIAKWLCTVGEKYAGKPSIRGSYEAQVPKSLQQQVLDKSHT